MTKIDQTETYGRGAGADSLAGYEYQIDVSVWLALDLVLISQSAEELILEPTTQEDLEITLTDSEPGRLVSRLPMPGYTLIVQAKLRGGDAWTPKTLKTLLEHGSDTRISAANRLKDPNSRYLLVTSASVNGAARQLNRRQPGTWPKPGAMPITIAKGIAHDISGRVAIIASQDAERLRGDINRLLTEGCRVPNALLNACRTKLREDARARIMRAGGGHWKCEELTEVIRKHEGYLASAPELEHYIHPNNWNELRAAMAKNSAALIIGQSGTGKTLATKMLYDELRMELPGLTRVLIRHGPSQLRDDTTPPPVLYDIEDPWGRFDFDPNSRPWNDQLGSFFATARPDRMILATSRLDVAQESGTLGTVEPWSVRLEAENYGRCERQHLYRSRIDTLPRDLQKLARGSELQVLDKLATPLEIQKFFDAMRTQERGGLKDPQAFVAAAIDHSHQDSIEQTVIEQIEERDDVRAAAIVWALLTANDKFARSLLREIEDHLADMDAAMEKGVSPLVDFFVAARNLRQSEGGIVTYYHPRVEAGIIRTLNNHRQVVRRTLNQLIDHLVSNFGPGVRWGAGAAARILARAADQFGVKPSVDAVPKIDAWLETRLAEGGKNFETHLELAACVGSSASNGAETARFLLHRPDKSFGGMKCWNKQKYNDEWYGARANDPSTKPLLEAFIITILTQDRIGYPQTFADEIARLSSGLTVAFLDAAKKIVHYGYIASHAAVAHGALNDIAGFEEIVDIAVKVLTPTGEEIRKAAAIHLDITNDVYSYDYAQYIGENDDGYTAREFLEAYVKHVREQDSWRRIAHHAHVDMLRPYWLRALADLSRIGVLDSEELAGAFEAGYGTRDEDDLWRALSARWDPRYFRTLEARIREGADDVHVDKAALACLLKHDSKVFPLIVADLVERRAASRLVEIGRLIVELQRRRHSPDYKKQAAVAEVAMKQLPPPFDEICRAELAIINEESFDLSAPARDILAAISDAGDQVRTLRLQLDASIPMPIEGDVCWALEVSNESKVAVLGIEAAIRHGITGKVEAALDHRFAYVAALALKEVASPLTAPLPERLLGLATHRASPVRRTLVEILKTKPNAAHKNILIKLAGDQWAKDTMFYGHNDHVYPIARTAISALSDIIPLDDRDNDALFAIATDTSDQDVRNAIFRLLAKSGTTIQKKLFDLAVEPGRPWIRSSAAFALFQAGEQIDQLVIDEISPRLLTTNYEPVACVLAILAGWRGAISAVRAAAEELATNSKRRVLLLLMVWPLTGRDRGVAEEIAAMLPKGHEAVAWALDGTPTKVNDATIADLGDQAICAEVIHYIKSNVEE
ncbi:hypothetical protein [Desulfolutivibrio sp.]|uniref:hypothetical protein n=1 Tax=Desulfolutivibrio sp. TaxID=2773296 RepID=UPI002F96C5C7